MLLWPLAFIRRRAEERSRIILQDASGLQRAYDPPKNTATPASFSG